MPLAVMLVMKLLGRISYNMQQNSTVFCKCLLENV